MVSKFFSLFISREKSYLVSFLFIFYPIHDATTFWYIGEYLTLSVSFYLFAYYLIANEHIKTGMLVATMASFVSYGSTPVAISLFLLFILQKEYKKGILLFVPNMVYISYYIIITKYLAIGTQRINESSITILIKNLFVQVATTIDTMIGPSFIMKLYYSITSITISSFIIVIVLTFLFTKKLDINKDNNKNLILAFLFMMILSIGMFAITGKYPQIAFNLGNRVTIYSSLFFVFFIALISNKRLLVFLVFILLLSIFGISDHWKGWNKKQQNIINNISKNQELINFDKSRELFVVNNQYSNMGGISNIEFFSESIVQRVFKLTTNNDYKVQGLSSRFIYTNGYLVDTKYNTKTFVKEYIYVYDTDSDKVFKIYKDEIKDYINKLPKEKRHWIQFLDSDNIIKKIIVYFVPKVDYLFK
jgi:hypothetical protein